MDFDKIVSEHKSRTCVISVEQLPDGSYGNILVVAANKALRADAEMIFHHPFEPNTPYYYYLPQDKNFEDFMFICACQGKPLHTYVRVEQMGLWVNMFLLPLESDKENVGYCMYSCDISPDADTEQQASLSANTATNALEISLKLRTADQSNYIQVFDEIIEDIRRMSGAEHCSIFLDHEQTYSVFSEASANDALREIYNYDGFYDIARSFDSTISGSSCVIIKDENDMKWLESVNKPFHSMLIRFGINSLVLYPLKHKSQILGYLWCLNYNTDDTVNIKETLELSTYLIGSEISNYLLMKQLELLSSVDILTGCRNRNAMNKTVDDIVAGKTNVTEPYVVVFADLNGLKRINDEKGHSAGDALIRTAAALLSQVFHDCNVFRAGGDEFMLIADGLTESDVIDRLKQLKDKSAVDPDVHFAVGYYSVSNGEDIRTAMRIADERMYADKNDYYAQHPELKYR